MSGDTQPLQKNAYYIIPRKNGIVSDAVSLQLGKCEEQVIVLAFLCIVSGAPTGTGPPAQHCQVYGDLSQ